MNGTVKGWCPGALRPMESGDGYLLRLRPFRGRLSAQQTTGLAALAQTYGIDSFGLSNRANLQLRGIKAATLPDLQRDLAGLGLIDTDPKIEARRNIMMTPFSQHDDLACSLHDLLVAQLPDAPALPAKFGFAIDTGPMPCLQNDPADLRFERSGLGLILRADGQHYGELQPDPAHAVQRAIQIAAWFADQRNAGSPARRMRQLQANGLLVPLAPDAPPLPQDDSHPIVPAGRLLYAPFGDIPRAVFTELAGHALQLTPWRAIVLLDPVTAGLSDHWISTPDHPLLRISACPGAPLCASATVETRDLARRLAGLMPAGTRLHVSGCAKGCAHPRAADLTLSGRDERFDLIPNGCAGDKPALTGLSPNHLSDILRGYLAP